MSLKELQEKREKLVHDAREALDEIKKNTDESRAAELDKRHDDIMADFDRVEKLIEREQKTADAEHRSEEARARNRPNPGDTEARGEDDGQSPDYRTVFYTYLSRGADLGELTPEERAVLRRGVEAKAEFRAQTVGTATAGGYTVPTELADFIVKSMKAWGPMYDEDICTVINTSTGNSIKIPTVDDTASTAEDHTEGTALTDDGGKDVAFGQKSLDSYGYDTEFVRFSLELARDSIFNMESLLGELLGERLGRIANARLTTGSGTGAPNGIVTASSLGKTATAAAAIASDELIDLVHSVDPAHRVSPKVRFMFNDLTLSALRKLKDGQGNYLWQMGDITKGQPGTLLGYRYSINQAMDSIAAAKKVVLFGDFGKYYVRKVGSPLIGVLRERFWPDLGIAGLIYFDGELGDTAAVKHLITAAS
ncbi:MULTISPECIES: phage major capsid protein [unclassified Chelatococcus]|uniref:phage major capsid protein n=1 Tax=unclassified Chelatococcus TaxID=2638111 RepID=UPI001BCCBC51|nr:MULTISPECIES: phage major capsid protein [unclassified Chelatococcus]MBS7699176.1 phage major capsid protein [Chelatococcus sp. YT9]MBX3554957.1 phage major capsid protein [Chelatococcus sp.]